MLGSVGQTVRRAQQCPVLLQTAIIYQHASTLITENWNVPSFMKVLSLGCYCVLWVADTWKQRKGSSPKPEPTLSDLHPAHQQPQSGSEAWCKADKMPKIPHSLSWGAGRVVWKTSTVKIAFKWCIMQQLLWAGGPAADEGVGEHELPALPPILPGAPGAAALGSPGHGSCEEERVSEHTEQSQGKSFCFLVILILNWPKP